MKTQKIFITFSEQDQNKAQRYINRLKSERPDWTLLGRQNIGFSCSADTVRNEISECEITLVLATRSTQNDPLVTADIKAGSEKAPPNALLVVWLDEEIILGTGGGFAQLVQANGAETVGLDNSLDALDRSLEQAERIKQIHVQSGHSPKPICNR